MMRWWLRFVRLLSFSSLLMWTTLEVGWLLRLVSGSLIDLRTQGEEVTHVLGERDGKEMRNHEAWRYAARLESRRR